MYLIIHETKITALKNILKTNALFTSSQTQNLGFPIPKGQGSASKRRLTSNPNISLEDPYWYEKYDEVDGVYFRLLNIETPINIHYRGDCVLVFSHKLLIQNKNNFIINTTENFGFRIAEEGIVGESQFTGEEGMSITDIKNLQLLEKASFDPYSSEVLITKSVSLSTTLQSIFVKKQYIQEVILLLKDFERTIQLYAL